MIQLSAHIAKHICNSHKPTRNQKLQKSLSISRSFLPTLKTIFFGDSSAPIEQTGDCIPLINRLKIETPAANILYK